jgi:DNA-binding PadR family transcriptional regulator
MEEGGWVISHWDETDSQGPKRRVYTITEEGGAFLRQWIDDLRRTQAEIDQLIAAYEKEESKA